MGKFVNSSGGGRGGGGCSFFKLTKYVAYSISIFNAFFLDIPFFQAHGEIDNILPLQYGINTSKILKQFLTKHEVGMIFTYKYLIARYSTMFSKFFGLLNLNFFFNVLPFFKFRL